MQERAMTVKSERLDPSDWVAEHGEAMFAYARLRLPSADAAEEAVQEALLASLRSRGSFDGRSSVRTWLIGVLRHKVLDALRASKRGPGELADEDSVCFCRGGFAENQAAWPADLGQAEVRDALRDALARLPEPMRCAIVLREIDGLPGATVCEIMGVSQTNLWTLVHRGKARLRKMLSDEFIPREDPR